jgi:hypothetical protein
VISNLWFKAIWQEGQVQDVFLMKMKNKCTQFVTILQTYQLGAMQKEFTLLGKFDVHTMHCSH